MKYRGPHVRRDITLAIVIALAVQGAFTAALTLPESVIGVPQRMIVGLSSVPFSALCATLFFRRRQHGRPAVQMVLLFCGLVAIIVVAGFVVSAATGNYDLP